MNKKTAVAFLIIGLVAMVLGVLGIWYFYVLTMLILPGLVLALIGAYYLNRWIPVVLTLALLFAAYFIFSPTTDYQSLPGLIMIMAPIFIAFLFFLVMAIFAKGRP